jgi:hypothetical protein
MQGHLGNSQGKFHSKFLYVCHKNRRIYVTLNTTHKGRQQFLRLTLSSIKLFQLYSKASRNYTWIILHHHFIPKGSYCHSSTALRHNHKLINESNKHSLKVSLQILLLHNIIISFVFRIFLGHRQKANSNKCTKHLAVRSSRNALPCIYRVFHDFRA